MKKILSKKNLALTAILLLVLAYFCYPKTTTLKLGIYVGSSWDIPNTSSYEVIDKAIKKFESEHKNVKVVYDSGILKSDYSDYLASQIVQGEDMDVIMVLDSDFNTLCSIKALKPLNEYLLYDKEFDGSQYYSGVLNSGYYNNMLYALPFECNVSLMFVNKTLLENNQIELPQQKWTLNDFYSICERVTLNDKDNPIFGAYNYTWKEAFNAYQISLFDREGSKCNLNQNEVKEAIAYISNLKELNDIQPTSVDFDNGNVAFMPMTLADYRAYKPYPYKIKKYNNFKWECLEMPSVDGISNASTLQTSLIGISANSKHDKLGWEFLKTLCYDSDIQSEVVLSLQSLSGLKEVMNNQDVINEINKEIEQDLLNPSFLNETLENARYETPFKKRESALLLLDNKLNELYLKDEGLDRALINIQKEINHFLEQ